MPRYFFHVMDGHAIVDTEGLDCEMLASQDWLSAGWCALSPTMLIFEWRHCRPDAYLKVTAALQQVAAHRRNSSVPLGGLLASEVTTSPCPNVQARPGCVDRSGSHVAPYRLVAETRENAFFTRMPRKFFLSQGPKG